VGRTCQLGAALAGLTVIVLASAGSGQVVVTRDEVAEPKAEAPEAPVARDPKPATAEDLALVEYLARRYRIARSAAGPLVAAAREAGDEVQLDPLLILAVIAIESRFNPFAESFMGAKGLMQIIPTFHMDKLAPIGGEETVLHAVANIFVGSRILSEYISRNGSLEAGLQFYNGAAWDGTARYAQKVLAERERLRQAVHRNLESSAQRVAPQVPSG
jgi:hypothetical protein